MLILLDNRTQVINIDPYQTKLVQLFCIKLVLQSGWNGLRRFLAISRSDWSASFQNNEKVVLVVARKKQDEADGSKAGPQSHPGVRVSHTRSVAI